MLDPEELFLELRSRSSARKVNSLTIVNDVCREQHKNGSKDFSVATIAKIAAARGGPAAQTIHNKTGDDFKAVINAWANFTGGSLKKATKTVADPDQTILDHIDAVDVRAVVGGVLSENRRLRRQVDLLKANAQVVIDRRPATAFATPQGEFLPAAMGLLDSEKDALRHAISEKVLADAGWAIDEGGRIISERTKLVIFKTGFVTAIRKVLAEK